MNACSSSLEAVKKTKTTSTPKKTVKEPVLSMLFGRNLFVAGA